ncbi:unnamed protein product [Paramecium pentaurelia]|uniref:Uncharacterized protein n=1 Tax=Paramecium pentaurelia TaxID=43138 RepID=A0A8S1UCI4_9CILI|nr:unnamed protein product [Paramecium pentaurelia]
MNLVNKLKKVGQEQQYDIGHVWIQDYRMGQFIQRYEENKIIQ